MSKEHENQHLLERFIEMLRGQMHASPHTIAAYSFDLAHFFQCVGKADTATKNDLQCYLKILVKDEMEASSIARRMSCLRHFYRFLSEEGLCTDNPMTRLSLPRLHRPLPDVLAQEDVTKLLEFIAADEEPASLRLQAILELLYGCGLRVSELVSLPVNALEYDEGKPWLFVRGKGLRERLLPVHATAQTALEKYLAVRKLYIKTPKQRAWLFPSSGAQGHLTRQRINQLLKETAINIGIDPAKISPHGLRHAFATHLLQNGADLLVIQNLLGHANIQTTEIYTHIMPQQVSDLISRHHPLAQKKRANETADK